jgi:hypothetical protein
MPPKKKTDPSLFDAINALKPELLKRRPPQAYTPTPTNLDFMSDADRHAASSKGGQTTQRRRHAATVSSPDIARQLSVLGNEWEKAWSSGADTIEVEQAIRGIVEPCFRNGVPNEDAVKMLNKYASPLRVQQKAGSVHVTLQIDAEPEIVVKGGI